MPDFWGHFGIPFHALGVQGVEDLAGLGVMESVAVYVFPTMRISMVRIDPTSG